MSVRLDKYLSDFTELTRSQAKKEIRAGRVWVNENIAARGEERVSSSDVVIWNGNEVSGEKYRYIMLNKPAGIVSATRDNRDETVVEYVSRTLDIPSGDLFPMGRLDKDTEGLLILTNDGGLAHRLLTPKNHIRKKYFVRLDTDIDETDVEQMRQGLDIGEKHLTKPAEMEILTDRECYLTITEGKFHQIKRMFGKLGKTVIYLKRVSMGALCLDETLQAGECRFLTKQEILLLSGQMAEEEEK